MAKSMVTQFGMSEKLGMVQYGGNNEYVFLGRDMAQAKEYSEDTAQQIDDEVKRIISECYECAESLIKKNRDKLKIIAEALLEYERSEEHTSELQSQAYLVCRLLLEKKKTQQRTLG